MVSDLPCEELAFLVITGVYIIYHIKKKSATQISFYSEPFSFRFFNYFGWKGAIQRSLLLGSVGNRSSLLQKN